MRLRRIIPKLYDARSNSRLPKTARLSSVVRVIRQGKLVTRTNEEL